MKACPCRRLASRTFEVQAPQRVRLGGKLMVGRKWRVAHGVLAAGAVLALGSPAFAQDAPKQVTFTKDVAPIFQAKCQSCHQPNSIAPMSLISYQESRPWARSIKDRVSTRQMPPWHIDPSVGV